MKPKLLDLFCGAGGASVGYHRAGFDVTGCDMEFHADYPFPMIVGDAMSVLGCPDILAAFDVIAASPPCPRYSAATPAEHRDKHPDLVGPVRDALRSWGGIYAIENVPGAPLDHPIVLCGSMFGLGVRRHRLFETNILLMQPECHHELQGRTFGVYGDHGDLNGPVKRPDGTYRGQKARDAAHAREVMGIDWMVSGERNGWADIADAIPPAYTQWLGERLLEQVRQEAAA